MKVKTIEVTAGNVDLIEAVKSDYKAIASD
jgi:hypothetical protein